MQDYLRFCLSSELNRNKLFYKKFFALKFAKTFFCRLFAADLTKSQRALTPLHEFKEEFCMGAAGDKKDSKHLF